MNDPGRKHIPAVSENVRSQEYSPASGNPERKRVKRACDQCSTSRTRCNGCMPCKHCVEYNRTCQYTRQVKKRGRISRDAVSNNRSGTVDAAAEATNTHDHQHSTSFITNTQSPGDHDSDGGEIGLLLSDSAMPEKGFSPTVLSSLTSSISTPKEPIQSTGDALLDIIQSQLGIHGLPQGSAVIHDVNSEGCVYPVLTPVLQHIAGIISPAIACKLLDLYFTPPSGSLFEYASPFVLAHIFREKSFLHPTSPRKTSPALLLCMLWVAAQTSNLQVFHSLVNRSKICDQLLSRCFEVLGPLNPELYSRSDVVDVAVAPETAVDIVLTVALVAIVFSGGEPKRRAIPWWQYSLFLAREYNLNTEPEDRADYLLHVNTTSSDKLLSLSEERKEERRRMWWLLYAIDRHLSLSYNAPIGILDAECRVYVPLDEITWQEIDTDIAVLHFPPRYGPPMTATGCGFFEYFVPLMVILGDILDLHHRKQHPRFGSAVDTVSQSQVGILLQDYESSIITLALSSTYPPETLRLVVAYSKHIVHVLYVLLYGKWDPISMINNENNFLMSVDFEQCMTHSIEAANLVSEILRQDPEMRFMPYLFGIYLLHGSFMFLISSDRNTKVMETCDTVIRAYEVCLATLNTEYQRSFRNLLRSAMRNDNRDEAERRKMFLGLYRWSGEGRGLIV